MSDRIERDASADGIDRRGFLKCMAWAGTGVLWTVSGGILTSRAFGAEPAAECQGGFSPSPRSATAISASTRTPTRT